MFDEQRFCQNGTFDCSCDFLISCEFSFSAAREPRSYNDNTLKCLVAHGNEVLLTGQELTEITKERLERITDQTNNEGFEGCFSLNKYIMREMHDIVSWKLNLPGINFGGIKVDTLMYLAKGSEDDQAKLNLILNHPRFNECNDKVHKFKDRLINLKQEHQERDSETSTPRPISHYPVLNSCQDIKLGEGPGKLAPEVESLTSKNEKVPSLSIEEIMAKQDQLEQKLTETVEILLQVQTALCTRSQEVTELTTERDQLKQRVEETRKLFEKASEQIYGLEKTNAILTHELTEKTETHETLRQQCIHLTVECASYRVSHHEALVKISVLEGEKKHLQMDKENLHHNYQTLELVLEETRRENEHLKKDRVQLGSCYKRQIDEKNTTIKNLTETQEALKQNNKDLEEKPHKKRCVSRGWRNRYDTSIRENEDLNKKLSEATKTIDTLKKQVEVKDKQIETLERVYAEKEPHAIQTSDEVATLNASLEIWRTKHATLYQKKLDLELYVEKLLNVAQENLEILAKTQQELAEIKAKQGVVSKDALKTVVDSLNIKAFETLKAQKQTDLERKNQIETIIQTLEIQVSELKGLNRSAEEQ